mmetsp:Transcript_2119/g.3180  ORF Transcript_2119/g.3180 Transcript_2119/m.3180 type:complete len:110 (-) Transcript_2119:482-811(-)
MVLLAVRNPLDAIYSFFQMIATQSHTKSFLEDINHPDIKPFWDRFFEDNIRIYKKWHDFWMEKVRTSDVPIYFFRFEDLLLNPEPILKNMFRFILAKKDLDGTVIEKRI